MTPSRATKRFQPASLPETPKLGAVLADRWLPLHARVTNTSISYADALEMERRQDRMLLWAGVGLFLFMAVAMIGLLAGGAFG